MDVLLKLYLHASEEKSTVQRFRTCIFCSVNLEGLSSSWSCQWIIALILINPFKIFLPFTIRIVNFYKRTHDLRSKDFLIWKSTAKEMTKYKKILFAVLNLVGSSMIENNNIKQMSEIMILYVCQDLWPAFITNRKNYLAFSQLIQAIFVLKKEL